MVCSHWVFAVAGIARVAGVTGVFYIGYSQWLGSFESLTSRVRRSHFVLWVPGLESLRLKLSKQPSVNQAYGNRRVNKEMYEQMIKRVNKLINMQSKG